MDTSALPDIYTLALGPAALWQMRIYQAKHSFIWYNYIKISDTHQISDITSDHQVLIAYNKLKEAGIPLQPELHRYVEAKLM